MPCKQRGAGAVVVGAAAFSTNQLSAGGCRKGSRSYQQDAVQGQVVAATDMFAHGVSDFLQLRDRSWRLDFHHQSRLLCPVYLHAESRGTPRLGMTAFRGPLQILR